MLNIAMSGGVVINHCKARQEIHEKRKKFFEEEKKRRKEMGEEFESEYSLREADRNTNRFTFLLTVLDPNANYELSYDDMASLEFFED